MNYPLRDRYHRVRKSLINVRDSFLPKKCQSEIIAPIFEKEGEPFTFSTQALLPAQARSWLSGRINERETEGLYKTLSSCTVEPKCGILFHNGRVIWGSSDTPERERSPRVLPHVLGKSAKHLDNAILLHHTHGDNYFHFVLYVLSKVWLIEKHGLSAEIPFLINEKTACTRFFRDAVDAGAFRGRKVIVQKINEIFKVDQVYLPRPFFCKTPALSWVADCFRHQNDIQNGKPIFALRSKDAANGRVFRNQAEVINLVENYGFQVIDPAALTLLDQAKVFAQAPAIAGAHGAGLTNMIFRAGADTSILELFNPGMGSPHYCMLAHELGFQYTSEITENPQGRAFTASTEVNLKSLKNQIDLIFGSSVLSH